MPLSAGTKLGTYEVLSAIGAGGMGEVYQAHDTKLGRDVAIKALPEAFAHDTDQLSRFRREAKLLASLNHPNIATIHGLEDSNGTSYLVMELVPGETLAQRIKRDGAVPVEEALTIAKQIAEALEAAHERGVIHRDLKPANVKLTPEGKVKVLDFGLAKAFAGDGANEDPSNSPTLTQVATMQGVILGTAAYMSPEQAKGKAVDKRTDIWAFGCVLYELLTGKQTFHGEDVADILAAVVRAEPDWLLLPAATPLKVRDLLQRCLQKDKTRRLRDAGDARIEIEDAIAAPKDSGVTSVAVPAKRGWRQAVVVGLVAVVAGVAAGGAVWSLRPVSHAAVVARFAFVLGKGQVFTNGVRTMIAISPDGTQIVYVANQQLYLRPMGELEAKIIPGTEDRTGIYDPVFSPDGGSIAFFSVRDKTIKRIATVGGAAISLSPAVTPWGMSWSEDGILFGQGTGGIMRVSANGGEPEPLVTLKSDEQASAPQMLPGGKAFLFSLATGTAADRWDKAKVVVQMIGSAERKVLIEGGSDGHYVPTGDLVYAFSGTLRAVTFDLKRLEVTGGSVPVVEGVSRGTATAAVGTAQFSFSSNGSLAYVPGPVSASTANSNLALIDREGHLELLKLQPGPYSVPRVSPNGKQVAFQTDDGKEAIIWIYDLSGATSMRRLTFGGRNRSPVWSPDSKWVTFQSDREGDLAIFQQRTDGSGTPERLTKPDADTSHLPDSWSPDGNTLLFELKKGSSGSLQALSLGDKKVTPFGNIQNSNPIDAVFSNDGRWVAYTSRETGQDDIFVQPFPATGAKYQIPKNGDNHAPVWSADGKELFYAAGPGQNAVVNIAVKPSFAVGNAAVVFGAINNNAPGASRNFDIMPDGKHMLYVVGQEQTGAASAPQIQVVLNWFDDLKRKVLPGK